MPAAVAAPLAASLAAPVAAAPEPAAAALDAVDDPLEQQGHTRLQSQADGGALAQSWLQLSGLYCAACAGLIEQALQRVDGVQRASVVAATQRASVHWDPARTRLSQLITAVRDAGYGAVPDAAAPAREQRRREQRSALWRWFVASFCMMQVMMFATPSYVAGPGELTHDLRQLLNWGSWLVTLPVMVFAAGPFFRAAWQQLRARRIGMDVPVALALAVTFIGSTGATFDPDGLFGHEVFFDSLTMFLSFLLGGRYLELRARHRAAEDLERALSRLPDWAERRSADGRWERVSLRRLQRGDVLRVAVGQAFPADGLLLEGETRVDESLLTGESEPLARAPGAAVVAASLNVGAPVLMQVDRVGADTRFETIVAMMRDALSQRPAGARLADRWAGVFLWSVLALAAGGAAVWSVIDPSRALWVAVSVLIVTCPCAFSLAAPAALVAAAGGLARRGVIFQRLEAIEALAGVNQAFVDKTGTLTEDRLQLRDMRWRPQASVAAADCAAAAASLAGWSQHPLSRALAAQGAAADDRRWQAVQEVPGHGIQAHGEDGACWRLGSRAWVGGEDGPEGPIEDRRDGHRAGDGGGNGAGNGHVAPATETGEDDCRVWLSRNGERLAGFVFEEALRPGAAEAVAGLQAAGVPVALLTGDDAARARALAARLGIADVHARATPEGKLALVAAAQARGARVLMVGDGINDAPVLARADVSLAMGQGALVARTQADAVIASNRPVDLFHALQTARRTLRIVRQNLGWALAYNLLCIPLALVGWLPPWAAGLGMAASSLLVIGNALRAAR